MPTREAVDKSGGLPDPGESGSLDDLVIQLRRLKVWAGDPSYESIKDRVNAAWTAAGRPGAELAGKSTVADCFRRGRRRLNADLVLGVVEALHPDPGYLAQWRQALRVVGDGKSAALQVRVEDHLPRDMPGFVGRSEEVDGIRRAVRGEQRIVAISGMAGVGKTSLAVRAGLLLAQEYRFDRIFFVNLRGFHADPAQPPVDPGAVLDGFLGLLGVPVQQLPHGLGARVAAFGDRLAGLRVLVVLDNAADEKQIRPLIADSPGCLTLVTSRRRLTALPDATPLGVEVFSPEQSEQFLARAVPGVPVGADPGALARIARRCGHLPLALGLIAGHIAGLADWTLTDHADRLDKRHEERRLDTAVELTLDLSYQHLPADEQRLLRLLALHPGHDFDAYAAAALTGLDLPSVNRHLRRLCLDNLLQAMSADRYVFHDLVRAYATVRVGDEESPSAQHAALTRLFDYYLATAATAMDTLFPAETTARPEVPRPATPTPEVGDDGAARAWLTSEHLTFVAVSTHATTHGWYRHAVQLSSTLFRFLGGGHNADALIIHANACDAAERGNDPAGHAHALTNAGAALGTAGHPREAAEQFQRALDLFRQQGDLAGQVRALGNLAIVEEFLGRYNSAAGYFEQAARLGRQIGDRIGEARALGNLCHLEVRLGRYPSAADRIREVLELCVSSGDEAGEARALLSLGDVEMRLGHLDAAAEALDRALRLFQKIGYRAGEGWALHKLGSLEVIRGRFGLAGDLHREALKIFRDAGDREGEAQALNGLGHVASTADRPAEALADHDAAYAIASEADDSYGQAMALAALGRAHGALNDFALADRHYRRALALYRKLGVPEAGEVEADLAGLPAQEASGANPAR
ncbi:MAG: tetratricopeptide repeat protein [Actinoplanes sp.]